MKKLIVWLLLLLQIVAMILVVPLATGDVRSGKAMKTPAIKTLPERKAICLEHRGAYWGIGPLFKQIEEFGKTNKLVGKTFGIYFDDPSQIKPESCRSELGILLYREVPGFKENETYRLKILPKQTVVFMVVAGPYHELPKKYGTLITYAHSSGYERSGPITEIYLNPDPKLPPEKLLAEIQIPIKRLEK